MKVLVIARSTLLTATGGDTIQVNKTVSQLTKYGVIAHIRLTNDPIDYAEYDLLHFFNITRPADIYYHIRKARKPFVVSPILINYSQYDKLYRRTAARLLFRFTSTDCNEYLKTMARWLVKKDCLRTLSYIWRGQRRSINAIIRSSSLLLPNSIMEQEQLASRYYDGDYKVIPNGIDPSLFTFDRSIPKDPLMVLCVARIEGIKNQLNLIKALNGTPYKLILIGAPAPNQLAYYQACRSIAGPNISFIPHLPQEELLHWYQQAKVHVLPSWFETCGLASLEAGAMGCNIVITDKGYTREYFEDYAFYCDPASPESIRHAVEKAANAPVPDQLRNKIIHNYTWQKAAEKTLAAYKQALQTTI
jgi:glycosyltransferase involved in cell wall biosynthesis